MNYLLLGKESFLSHLEMYKPSYLYISIQIKPFNNVSDKATLWASFRASDGQIVIFRSESVSVVDPKKDVAPLQGIEAELREFIASRQLGCTIKEGLLLYRLSDL
ncbi:MAG: hypothetical protein KatS3mg071_1596 [Meiothermus sp.]|nr:MAG: hypothetical protein KatS3mg071_1596 [Meiothermus sp.]